jgi:hypothetical protein
MAPRWPRIERVLPMSVDWFVVGCIAELSGLL